MYPLLSFLIAQKGGAAKKAAAPKPAKKASSVGAKKAAPKKKAPAADSDDDGFALDSEDDGPNGKLQKAGSFSKSKVVEQDDEDANGGTKKKAAAKSKTIEETYEKLDLREHVLKRPDTYVGSVRKQEDQSYILESEERGMVLKTVSFAPGLYKIFDEILVNAADNLQRDKSMDTVKVNIDPLTNTIIVYNNGEGTSNARI